MKKEIITTLRYGVQYVITLFVLMAITGNVDFEYSTVSEWVVTIIALFAPVIVMIIMNGLRARHDELLIKKIEERRNEAV